MFSIKPEPLEPPQPSPACSAEDIQIELTARANLPTRFGTFALLGFTDSREGKEHTAVIQGEVGDRMNCPIRVHSECHTGDIFGSLRCDCRDQLEASLQYISARPFGAVIYLRQEGRGIGLFNKIKAYRLQDEGLDTVEANLALGFPADVRDYRVAAAIIRCLGIRSILLLTNNPKKIEGLRREGIAVSGRIPLIARTNRYNRGYLRTKKVKLGHLL